MYPDLSAAHTITNETEIVLQNCIFTAIVSAIFIFGKGWDYALSTYTHLQPFFKNQKHKNPSSLMKLKNTEKKRA